MWILMRKSVPDFLSPFSYTQHFGEFCQNFHPWLEDMFMLMFICMYVLVLALHVLRLHIIPWFVESKVHFTPV